MSHFGVFPLTKKVPIIIEPFKATSIRERILFLLIDDL